MPAGTRRLKAPGPKQGFRVLERDGLRLFVPTKRKHLWREGEHAFRSLILDRRGRVVSAGFPKFFNSDEGQARAERRRLAEQIRAGAEVQVEEKLDGALIIRSVIGGEVVFCTRGTFDGGERGREARRIAARRYPQLLDPEVMAGSILLFEHLSSDERFAMVLDYGRDDLVFLDAVEHETLRLADPREKERIAGSLGLNPARSEPLPASLTELERAVRRRRGQEGVVVRFDSGQTLLKVKSSDYMRLPRMRYRLSDSEIVEFCGPPAQKRRRLELISSASPVATAVCEAEKHAESRFDELESMVDELFLRHAGKTERIKAEINELPEGERDAALLIFDDREGPAAERLRDAFIAAALARRSPAES